VADLVVAFMSLQDVDDMAGAVREVARILTPGGRLCLAIVHPLNSAGSFEGKDLDAPFVIRGSYLDRFDYVDDVERDGLTMRFHSRHRPFDDYSRALENASFVLEAVREVTDEDEPSRWQRVPYFLHLRARRA
jgi:SAM-dependent methyltransferase